MEKVLLALGNRNIEQEIVHNIENNFNVVGAVIRKGQILSAVKETRPDILVLRETLEGNENIKIKNRIPICKDNIFIWS